MDLAVETTKNARRRSRSETEAKGAAYAGTESARMAARLDNALRNLNDLILLNRNPLCRMAFIESLAAARYGGMLLPRGRALRSVILDCVETIYRELGDESGLAKVCRYLNLRSCGASCQQISSELELSREHVSRVVRKRALELLAEEFLSVTRRDGQ